MELIIIKSPFSRKHFVIDFDKRKDPSKIWIENEESEGGEFPKGEVYRMLYDAIEKYYDEKF